MESSGSEVIRIARALLAGDIDTLAGCRLLARHLSEAGLREDEDAHVITAVEWETGDLPLLQEEQTSESMDLLLEHAEERKALEEKVREHVHEACCRLVLKLSRNYS